jgi:hypothetical protein
VFETDVPIETYVWKRIDVYAVTEKEIADTMNEVDSLIADLTVTATGADVVDRLRDKPGCASAEKIDLYYHGKLIDETVKVWSLCHCSE